MIDNVYKTTKQEMRLSELAWVRTARRPERVSEHPFKGSVPYIDIKALETATPSRYAWGAESMMCDCDLVMVKDGYRSGKVFRAVEGIAASTFVVLSPDRNVILVDYLYCYLTNCYDDFQKMNRGTIIAHLDIRYLKDLVVPVPDMDMQREVAKKYMQIETLANATKDRALRLKKLSVVLENKGLTTASENLYHQVEMIRKAWLHQIFDRAL